MTQCAAVPLRKVFAELFSKSDLPRPQAPPDKSNFKQNGADSSESAPFCFHYEVKEAYSLHFLKANQHSAKLGVEAAETAKGMDLYLGVFEFGMDHVF